MNRKEKRMMTKVNKSNMNGVMFMMGPKEYNENVKKGEEIINRYISEEEDFEILKLYNRLLNNQAPTDLIQMSELDYDKLINRFKKDKMNNDLSSDIIVSGLVSLLDTEIEFNTKEGTIKTRVLIGENYQELIKFGKENHADPVIGCIMIYNNIFNYVYPISLNSNNGTLLTTQPFPSGFNNKNIKFSFDKNDEEFKMMTGLLSLIVVNPLYIFSLVYKIWYTIQISMLHPVLKNIYSNSSLTRKEICSTNTKSKNKKKKITYCKKHIINEDKISKVITDYKASHKNQRHEMLWYVAGHWRTYKDGRKIFIKPHWRGPLRDSKNKTGIETRERVIPIEEKNED